MVILFFDGDCGLCNRAVVHFLNWERDNCKVQFAPLQGSTAEVHLSSEQTNAPYHSLLVLAGSAVYEKAEALKILAGELKNPLGYVAQIGLKFSPNSVVNAVYDFVARNRHRGSSFSCALHMGRALQSRILP
jgi:predicted DCC family thiol-disulfide oxidoreductase YuxK